MAGAKKAKKTTRVENLLGKVTKHRKTRYVLTLDDKMKVIQLLRDNKSEQGIVEELANQNIFVSKSQVHSISATRDVIIKVFEKKEFRPSAKVLKSRVAFPELNQAVYDWFLQMRNPGHGCKPLPISRAILQQRALHEAGLRGITNFKASNGWFETWKKNYQVGESIRLFGEAGDVDMAIIQPIIDELKQKLSHYKRKNIFNMDESGLLFRTLPSRTYLSPSDGPREKSRGSKTNTAKERVTLVFCVNATGTCKVPPLMVGTAKQPNAFRDKEDGEILIPYTNQRSAWVDRDVYRHWWNKIFLPAVREHAPDGEPVALLLDNCSGHDPDLVDPLGQVTVFFFPPNATSVFQPLDQGMISAFKVNYKAEMVSALVKAYSGNLETLREMANKAKKGRKGIKVGCSANLLDASRLTAKCWDRLTREAIVNCWNHSKCLPEKLPGDDEEPFSELLHTSPDELLSQIPLPINVCYELATLHIGPSTGARLAETSLLEMASLVQQGSDGIREGTEIVSRWFLLENEPQFIAAQEVQRAEEIADEFDAMATKSSDLSELQSMEMGDSLLDGQDNADDGLIEDLVKAASAIVETKIKDPVILAFCQGIVSHCKK